MRVRTGWVMAWVLGTAALGYAQNDKTRANSYDDAWEQAWVNHCRTVLQGGTGKTTGFVLHVGDSITHSNPYSQWPRAGAGPTAEDATIIAWFGGTAVFPSGQNDATSKNGLYLAVADTEANADGLRGMTAASGLRADEFLTGTNNGTTPMPAQTVTSTAQSTVSAGNTTYGGNLHATTVAAAFADAQMAVLMLGTNDASAGRLLADFMNDLIAIVNLLEGRNIVVVLSTIPPHPNAGALATSYNASLRSFAQTRGLPLIDYEAEILARRPGTSWNGTLLVTNDVHPTAANGGYDAASNPYSPGGNSATHTTGDACLNSGYLLRSWLTVQKLKEVKSYVVDLNNPPAPVPPPPAVPPGPNLDEGDNGNQCGCGSVAAVTPGALPWLAGLAALVLIGVRRLQ